MKHPYDTGMNNHIASERVMKHNGKVTLLSEKSKEDQGRCLQ